MISYDQEPAAQGMDDWYRRNGCGSEKPCATATVLSLDGTAIQELPGRPTRPLPAATVTDLDRDHADVLVAILTGGAYNTGVTVDDLGTG